MAALDSTMVSLAFRLINKFGKNLLWRKVPTTVVTSGAGAGGVTTGADVDATVRGAITPVSIDLLDGKRIARGMASVWVSQKALNDASWGTPRVTDTVFDGTSDTDPEGKVVEIRPVYSGDEIAVYEVVVKGWQTLVG